MNKFLFFISFAACASTGAFARDQSPAVPEEPQSVMRAARMFMQACGTDVQTYCAPVQSFTEHRACVMANKNKFSDSCKSFMASRSRHEHGQGAREMLGSNVMQAPGNGQR